MAASKKKKSPIRVGIWGLGRAGWSMHCSEIAKQPEGEFEIVAGCDVLKERLKPLKEKYPNAKTYTDGNKFLADKNIELVSVAVRSAQHVDYCLRALEAGKMVFLEKPIAISMKGVKKLQQAVKKYPGKLYFRQNRRMESCFNHVFDIMHSGILGEVYEIKLCRHHYSFRNDWQTLVSCGGGQLNNWGPHLIDQGLRFLESPLDSLWSDLKNVAACGDAEDHLKVVMRGKNGRVVDIEISGGISLPSPVYAVYGTRGSLVSENEQDIKLKYLDPKQEMPKNCAHEETPPISGSLAGSVAPKWIRKTIMTEPENGFEMDQIYHQLYLAIREGKKYLIKPEEALEVVKTTLKIKEQNPAFPITEDEFGK